MMTDTETTRGISAKMARTSQTQQDDLGDRRPRSERTHTKLSWQLTLLLTMYEKAWQVLLLPFIQHTHGHTDRHAHRHKQHTDTSITQTQALNRHVHRHTHFRLKMNDNSCLAWTQAVSSRIPPLHQTLTLQRLGDSSWSCLCYFTAGVFCRVLACSGVLDWQICCVRCDSLLCVVCSWASEACEATRCSPTEWSNGSLTAMRASITSLQVWRLVELVTSRNSSRVLFFIWGGNTSHNMAVIYTPQNAGLKYITHTDNKEHLKHWIVIFVYKIGSHSINSQRFNTVSHTGL